MNKLRNKILLIGFLLVGFFIFAPDIMAAGCAGTGTCYYVASSGTNNWSDTTKWYTTSGGIGGTNGSVPTTVDTAIFDSLTYATAYTITVNAIANSSGLTIGLPLTSGVPTFAGTSAITVRGNITFPTGMVYTHSGAFTLATTTGTQLITTNGVALTTAFILNGSGGTFQLQDNLTFNLGAKTLTYTAGTFDPQTYTVTINGANAGPQIIGGAWSFYNLTLNSTSGISNEIKLSSNITVTNTLTLAGFNNTTNRLLLSSTVRGTQRRITITGTTGNAYSNIDFQDIDLYDSAGQIDLSAITGLSGDGGGNNSTDMLLTSSQNQYWKHPASAGENWSSLNWYEATLTSTSSNRVPLPQDNVYFIAGSFAAGKTLTIDTTNLGKSVDFSAADNNPALSVGTTRIFGSLTWGTMTFVNTTCVFTFMGRNGTFYITTNGLTNAPNVSWTLDTASTTTYALADAFNMGSIKMLALNSGTFDAADQSVSVGGVTAASTAQLVVNMGNGTWDIIGNSFGNPWSFGSALTLNAEGSTLKFSFTPTANWSISPGGKTYNIVWFANGASTYSISFNTATTHTFAEFKDTGTAAHSLIFTAGQTISVGAFTVSGTSGNLITINSNTTATHALIKTGGGTICSDYLNIQHSVATPASTWYAGANSTNNQAVATAGSGWTFTACPTAAGGKDDTRIMIYDL